LSELESAYAILEARESRYRDWIEHAPDMIWVVDSNGDVSFLNKACENVTGHTKRELLDREPAGGDAPESLTTARDALTSLREDGPSARYEIRIVDKGGAAVDLEVGCAPLGPAAARAGSLAIARDVTARNQAQRAARNFEFLFSKAPMPMWVFDLGTLQCLDVNEAAVERYGYTRAEFMDMSIADLRPPGDSARFLSFLEQLPPEGHGNAGHWRHMAKGGRIFDAEVFWRLVEFDGKKAIFSMIQDITERRLLEEQLRQAHKLEAVGRLAGGIAHDFNNLLTVITGYSQLLLNRLDSGHPMHAGLDEIRRSAEKAAALTRQLVAFSRRQSLKPAILDLNALVSDMDKMLRHVVEARIGGSRIELVTRLSADKVPVHADPSQIEQAILNLALNARDAMPDGGALTLETATVEFATRESAAGNRPGLYAMVAVEDTGHGIEHGARDRLFEPFFSTKANEGAGLGLSAVYGIVQQHGGFILVSSETGRGSRFEVYLPRTADWTGKSAPEEAGGAETILVVEDDSGVLRLIAETLRSYGYAAVAVPNSLDALEMAGRKELHVDLLLTDVRMPEMNGPNLAAAWRMLRPNLKLLFISGDDADAAMVDELPELAASLLRKPFSGVTLARKVREVLDGAGN
jgi:two-component system cell cycle sensor histidine kinase/response regulator CckA